MYIETADIHHVTACRGKDSSLHTLDNLLYSYPYAAPCPPQITGSSLDCNTNVALLAWTPESDVAEVVINATSTLGHEAWCSSANATCELTGLQCGHTYTAVATAIGDHCGSGPSSGVDIITGMATGGHSCDFTVCTFMHLAAC